MKNLDIIRLQNALFYASHGVMSDEQKLGGKFEVDLELHCDLTEAKGSDNLHMTVNYERVYSVMKETVTGRKYYLIEALAEAIAAAILGRFERVERVIVRVRKPSAPVHGVIDYVEAQIEKSRE